jgi:energy-converting hydrogenase B subunit D
VNAFQAVCLALVTLAGTALVAIRKPLHQIMFSSFYGLLLTVFFMAFQAPDVALSQVAVGTLPLPLLLLLGLAKMEDNK